MVDISETLKEAKKLNEKDRREVSQKLLDYYHGYFTGTEISNNATIPYLQNLIAKRFPKNYKAMSKHIAVLNIIKPLTNERSMVFKKGVSLHVRNDDSGIKNDRLKQILPADHQMVLKTADRLKTLLKTILIRVNYRNGKIYWEIITPNVFNVRQNKLDPTEADAYIIMQRFVNTEDETTIHYKIWTKDKFWIEDEHGNYVEAPKDNPYGELPFVVVRDELAIDQFFIDIEEDLINAQDIVNLTKTMIEYGKAYHAFPTVKVTNWNKKKEIPVGAEKVVTLNRLKDVEEDYEILPSQLDIKQLRDELNEHIKEVFRSYGMTPPRETKQPTSGIALKLENYKLLERREDQLELWRSYLKELLRLTIKVWNTHEPLKKAKFTEDDIMIDFGEIHFPTSRGETLNNYQKEIDLGISSIADILQKENPDLSDERALELAKQNLKLNQSIKSEYLIGGIMNPAPGVEE